MNLAHSVREISPHFIQPDCELWIMVMNFDDSGILFMPLNFIPLDGSFLTNNSSFSENWEPLIIPDFLVLLGLNRFRTSVRSAILTNSRGMFIYNWTWKAHFGSLPGFRSRQGTILGFFIQ